MKKINIISLIECISCITIFLTCCGTLYGPYHHEALVCPAYHVVDVAGNKYYQYYYSVYRLDNGTFSLISNKMSNCEDYVHVNDMCTDGQFLYVATTGGEAKIFSSDYEYISTVELFDGNSCRSIVVDGNTIYCQSADGGELTLYAHNMQTGESTVIAEDFCDKTLNVEGRILFANSIGYLFWEDQIQGVNQAYGYYKNGYNQYGSMENGQYQFAVPSILQQTNISFCYNSLVGEISVTDGAIVVEYNNNEHECKIAGDTLYDNIVLYGDKLYFVAYDYIPNEGCINERCVCHMGQSELYCFDFQTSQFELLDTLESGFYTTFNGQTYTYYLDGVIYRENQQIMKVDEISPYGEYRTGIPGQYLWQSYVSQSIFYDDGSTLYYKYDDNRPYLKDTY